jgi:hypothetical protein
MASRDGSTNSKIMLEGTAFLNQSLVPIKTNAIEIIHTITTIVTIFLEGFLYQLEKV